MTALAASALGLAAGVLSPPGQMNLSGSPSGANRVASYTDVGQHVIGREYLGALHKAVRALTPGYTPPQIWLDGDSTTLGSFIGSAGYVPAQVLANVAGVRGFDISVVNNGQSAQLSTGWLNTFLPAELAATTSPPAAIVAHYGMNDPYIPFGNPLSPAQTIANHRAAFALIRSKWTADQTSLVFLMPTTTNDDAGGRNEAWREAIGSGMKLACRDYGVLFIDAYALFRDCRGGTMSTWMDNAAVPSGTAHIHPLEDFNQALWGLVGAVLFPAGLVALSGRANFRNVGSSVGLASATALPNSFAYGKSLYRAAAGWPMDGAVEVTRHADDMVIQLNYGYGVKGQAIRSGYANQAWGAWMVLQDGQGLLPVAPAGGFSPGATPLQTSLSGGRALGEGFLALATPGAIASGTSLGTVNALHAPAVAQQGVPLAATDGTSVQALIAAIAPSGAITTRSAVTLTATQVYFAAGATWRH